MNKFGVFSGFLALFLMSALPAMAADYDLVINNGRVMDPETMFNAVANVGIQDGKIKTITKRKISGKETIDATGMVVAPGFIDPHSHWQRTYGYKIQLRDGVTTSFDLEYGTVGTRVDEWYRERKDACQVNYGTSSSHEAARSLILDQCNDVYDAVGGVQCRAAKYTKWTKHKMNLEEGNKVLSVIDQGLQAGSIGIGVTVGYMRDGVTTREMLEVQRLGALYGRQVSVHTRYTLGDQNTEVNGAQEILANAVSLGAPASINHYNNPGWQVTEELLASLQNQGFNVWGEVYPYAAGSGTINSSFLAPEIWVDQLGHKYEETMYDPEANKFMTPADYDAMMKKDPTHVVVVYKMPESDEVEWLKLKAPSIAGDGMWTSNPDLAWDTPYEKAGNMHPRGAGAHGKALRLAREHGIPLMHVLSMMSYVSAKHFGDMGLKDMQVRGRIQKGMVADIVVFDPETVKDNATYTEGTLPTTGIPYVLVNGVPVVKDSKVQKVFPGQPIRFPTEAKPRFKPLDSNQWRKAHMVPEGMHIGDCLQIPNE